MLLKFSGLMGGTYCLKDCGLSIYKRSLGNQMATEMLLTYKAMRERQNYEVERRFDDRRDRDMRGYRDSRDGYGRVRSPPRYQNNHQKRDDYSRRREWRREPENNGRRSRSSSESDKQKSGNNGLRNNDRNGTKREDLSINDRSPELNRDRSQHFDRERRHDRRGSPRRDRKLDRSQDSSSKSKKSARSDSSSVSLPSHARSRNSSDDSRGGYGRRKGDNKFYKKVNLPSDRYAVYRKSFKTVHHGDITRLRP